MVSDLTKEEYEDYLKARRELLQIRKEMRKEGYPVNLELHKRNSVDNSEKRNEKK